jgi:hypothetical protein
VVLAGFEKLHNITYTILLSGVQALISTIIAAILMLFLLVLNPVVALIAGGVVVGAYGLISVFARRRLQANSRIIAFHWGDRIRRVQQALGGIRDILIDQSQTVFERDFDHAADQLRRASTANAFIAAAPRIVVEIAEPRGLAVDAVLAQRACAAPAACRIPAGQMIVCGSCDRLICNSERVCEVSLIFVFHWPSPERWSRQGQYQEGLPPEAEATRRHLTRPFSSVADWRREFAFSVECSSA